MFDRAFAMHRREGTQDMRSHTHSGFDMFLIVTVYAIVGLWLTRFVAAQLLERESTHALGKALGALVD